MNYEKRTIDTSNMKFKDYSEFLRVMMQSILEDLTKRNEKLLGSIRVYKSTFHVKTPFGLRSYVASMEHWNGAGC